MISKIFRACPSDYLWLIKVFSKIGFSRFRDRVCVFLCNEVLTYGQRRREDSYF